MVKNCNCMSRFSEDLIKCELGKQRLHGCTNPLQSIKAENGLVLGGILQALPYLLSSQIIRHHDSCHTGPKRPTRTITITCNVSTHKPEMSAESTVTLQRLWEKLQKNPLPGGPTLPMLIGQTCPASSSQGESACQEPLC